ncbi:hypothetical protein [Proteiniphilum sp.]|uniref:hypothetical protein n=1 Tax=Proteiniphilum sp. TaxID=1926877 RepID=UPI002B20D738|nr:hypothetical protein [Proteiniphilum sp.]MEA4916344.1 hypothetical protein [Proteiniphilum sp.]
MDLEYLRLLKKLTEDQVWKLSEEDVFNITELFRTGIVSKVEQSRHLKILEKVFEFRTISFRQELTKHHLQKMGYVFFNTISSENLLIGIHKRKKDI